MKTVSDTSHGSFLKQFKLVIAGVLLVTLAVAGSFLLSRSSPQPMFSRRINVVAAENFWGNVVSQLGGDKVAVTSIIVDPTADPHLYDSDAHDARAISEADIVLESGLGYDDFMDKLLGASPNAQRTVLSAATILTIRGQDTNPHVWYDIARVPEVARAVEKQLVAKDPADTSFFEERLRAFDSSLQPLLGGLAAIKTTYPHAPVAYTERVPGYLLEAAGLEVKTPEGFARAIERGSDPSPADQAAMASLITRHQIKALLYNAQTTSAVTQRIRDMAAQAGVPVVPMTETQPTNELTYQAWQLHQLETLQNALK